MLWGKFGLGRGRIVCYREQRGDSVLKTANATLHSSNLYDSIVIQPLLILVGRFSFKWYQNIRHFAFGGC